MNYRTCPVDDCCGGTLIADNGMRAKCRNCGGRGVVEAPRVTVTHDGPPVVTPARGMGVGGMERTFDHEDAQAYRDLFADLTPDEVRVITGLVRAMRDVGAGVTGDALWTQMSRANTLTPVVHCMHLGCATSGQMAHAAWHIAHAISQMGESC